MQEEIIKRSLKELREMDFNETTPEIAFRMNQHAKNISGINDNGHSAQGTILKNCSSIFKSEFSKAYLVISKGQANF